MTKRPDKPIDEIQLRGDAVRELMAPPSADQIRVMREARKVIEELAYSRNPGRKKQEEAIEEYEKYLKEGGKIM